MPNQKKTTVRTHRFLWFVARYSALQQSARLLHRVGRALEKAARRLKVERRDYVVPPSHTQRSKSQ